MKRSEDKTQHVEHRKPKTWVVPVTVKVALSLTFEGGRQRQSQHQRLSTSTRQVALRCHLPMFVLPCPDYAIRRAGAGSLRGNDGEGTTRREAVEVCGDICTIEGVRTVHDARCARYSE